MANHENVLHVAVVEMVDAKQRMDRVRFAGWTMQEAVASAWRFTKPKRMHGDIAAFNIRCHEEAVQPW